MNKNKWKSISPADQKVIEQINQAWIEKQTVIWERVDEGGKKFTIRRVNKIITLSGEENARWAAKAEPLFDDYVKNMKAKGLPGELVLKFAGDYLRTHGGVKKGSK